MHNLHFIIVKADSASDAASEAESEISNWGNENNWRSIGGVASEDGRDDIDNHDGGRWGLSFLDELEEIPKEGSYFARTVAYVQWLVKDPVTLEYQPWATICDFKEGITTVANHLMNFDLENGELHELWAASRNIKQLYELLGARRSLAKGNDLPEFYDWQFDQTGVTDMTATSDGKQRYIVFLDMHS